VSFTSLSLPYVRHDNRDENKVHPFFDILSHHVTACSGPVSLACERSLICDGGVAAVLVGTFGCHWLVLGMEVMDGRYENMAFLIHCFYLLVFALNVLLMLLQQV